MPLGAASFLILGEFDLNWSLCDKGCEVCGVVGTVAILAQGKYPAKQLPAGLFFILGFKDSENGFQGEDSDPSGIVALLGCEASRRRGFAIGLLSDGCPRQFAKRMLQI